MAGWGTFEWSLAFCWAFIALGLTRSAFFIRSMFTGAPSVPSSPAAVESMCALAELGPGKTAYDLGSGAGRLLLAAAARGARAVGLELDPFKVAQSRALAWASPDKARIASSGPTSTGPAAADVVFVYLTAGKMACAPLSKAASSPALSWSPTASPSRA